MCAWKSGHHFSRINLEQDMKYKGLSEYVEREVALMGANGALHRFESMLNPSLTGKIIFHKFSGYFV